MKPLRIIIIGSGLGGLAAGIRLAAEGYQVTIFEKTGLPGGCLKTEEINGFRFNNGAEIVTAPFLFDQLFERVGKNRRDYFDLQSFDPIFQAIFPGNKRFAFFRDPSLTVKLNNLFSLSDQNAFSVYLNENENRFDDLFFNYYSKPITDNHLKFGSQFRTGRFTKEKSSADMAAEMFQSAELRQLFGFWPLLAGGNPKESSHLSRIIPTIFNRWGAWIPVGGMKNLVDSLVNLFIEEGGEIFYNSEVQEIQVFNRKVSGVRLSDGSIQHADIVISDVDALRTYRSLIDSDKNHYSVVTKAKRMVPGAGVFIYHIGLNRPLQEKMSLAGNNFVFPENYETFLSDLFYRKILTPTPFFLMKIPSKNDLYAAPPGCESLSILVPVPNLEGNIEWERESYVFRNRILDLIQVFFVTDLRDSIIVETCSDPQKMQTENNSYLGAAFSALPVSQKNGGTRLANKCADIKNLYLVGAGSHPGPFIPGVLLGVSSTVISIKTDFDSE